MNNSNKRFRLILIYISAFLLLAAPTVLGIGLSFADLEAKEQLALEQEEAGGEDLEDVDAELPKVDGEADESPDKKDGKNKKSVDEDGSVAGNKESKESLKEKEGASEAKEEELDSRKHILKQSPAESKKGKEAGLKQKSGLRYGGKLDGDKAQIDKFEIVKIRDGIGPFDNGEPGSIDDPNRKGNDANDHNNKVRSFDKLSYDIDFVVNPIDMAEEFEEGYVNFEFVLPLSEIQAKWDTSSMIWLSPGYTIETKDVTYDFDGDGSEETVSCQILRGKKKLKRTESQPTAIPGGGTVYAYIDVLAMKDGDKINPVFTVWPEHSKSSNKEISDLDVVLDNLEPCSEHNKIEAITVKAESVSVTAELRLNLQLKQIPQSYGCIDEYDFNLGNAKAIDKGKGNVYGRATAYGITIQLYNREDRQLKGVEIPTGPITFDMDFETDFKMADGSELSDSKKEAIKKDYSPLILSWKKNGYSTAEDGRDLKDLINYAMFSAPGNSGMRERMVGSGSSYCYKGGNWNAVRDGERIKFEVTDYQIKSPLFPNVNLGNAYWDVRYFDPRVGIRNIGCFSAGYIAVVTPFYNNGSSDPSLAGKYIIDDVGGDGNFLITARDYNLKAKSASGQQIDNSDQMNKTDDKLVTNQEISPAGSFDWVVAWTRMLETNPISTSHFRDSQNRTINTPNNNATDGQDVAIRKQELALGFGVTSYELGSKANRLAAAEILCKFDSDVVDVTDETMSTGLENFGMVYDVLYATKADGSAWSSDEEMNRTEIEELKYYAKPGDIPAGHKCIALLGEIRPKDNNPDNVIKYLDGDRPKIIVNGRVRDDAGLLGNVYQCVIGGKAYNRSDWDAASGNIPSMLGNDPSSPIELPPASYKRYRKYEKVKYDESGYLSGHTGSYNCGDSVRIQKATPDIQKVVAQKETDGSEKQIFRLDNNERFVDFTLKTGFSGLPEDVSENVNITITDILDKSLHYVPGSAYLGGVYEQNEEQGQPGQVIGGSKLDPIVTTNADGTTTLRWEFENVSTGETTPKITYTAEIGEEGNESLDVKHGDSLSNIGRIRGSDDKREFNIGNKNHSEVNIQVSKLSFSGLSKIPGQRHYDAGDDISYKISSGNIGSKDQEDAIIMDVLPYNGDLKGSNYHGSLKIHSLKFIGKHLSNADSWKCYYTTDEGARDSMSSDYSANDIRAGSSIVNGETVNWTEASIGSDSVDIPSDQDVTAFVFLGTLKSKETLKVDLVLRNLESQAGDVIANGVSRREERTVARVYILNRAISGLTWWDADMDGQRSDEEKKISGVKVTILKKDETGKYKPFEAKDKRVIAVETGDGDSVITFPIPGDNNAGIPIEYVVSVHTNAQGAYKVMGLPPGDFGVRLSPE